MDSSFMEHIAAALSARGITVARFEFDYMAARRLDGKRRPPNPQASLLEQWKQAYRHLAGQMPGPVAIGGKSMGGRMASLLAEELEVPALVCLGYPFHPAGKPEKTRVAHLATIRTPTLIIQGTRDTLGAQAEVAGYSLASSVRLHWLEGADHDLKPLKSTGCSHDDYLEQAADVVAAFLSSHCS